MCGRIKWTEWQIEKLAIKDILSLGLLFSWAHSEIKREQEIPAYYNNHQEKEVEAAKGKNGKILLIIIAILSESFSRLSTSFSSVTSLLRWLTVCIRNKVLERVPPLRPLIGNPAGGLCKFLGIENDRIHWNTKSIGINANSLFISEPASQPARGV